MTELEDSQPAERTPVTATRQSVYRNRLGGRGDDPRGLSGWRRACVLDRTGPIAGPRAHDSLSRAETREVNLRYWHRDHRGRGREVPVLGRILPMLERVTALLVRRPVGVYVNMRRRVEMLEDVEARSSLEGGEPETSPQHREQAPLLERYAGEGPRRPTMGPSPASRPHHHRA